jgi:hypothetical protein
MDTKKKKSTQAESQKSDPHRWGKTVRVSNEIYNFISKNGEFGETFSDVLKRLLKI